MWTAEYDDICHQWVVVCDGPMTRLALGCRTEDDANELCVALSRLATDAAAYQETVFIATEDTQRKTVTREACVQRPIIE